MNAWGETALQASYFAVLLLLALYGLHRLWLVGLCLTREGPATSAPPAGAPPHPWPVVTVQLPIYNERRVARRLIDAACALDYPRDLLEIQVLDDSTDETTRIVADAVASYRALGVDIHHLTRPSREGYKAGALAAGLIRARGELIAVFDADFVPPCDFLMRCVPRFEEGSDPKLGMVQARWGHLNRRESWLTRAQALLLDAHFAIEHAARCATGRFINFNGTAGLFRRRCIEQAGGWQADTLTEDLDLSYRAQMAGWRFEYLGDVEVPAELPARVAALRSQQRRWAKGSIQTAIKLLPALRRAPLPAGVKLEALAHLTGNLPWLLMCVLAALIVPALRARAGVPWTYAALDLPLLAAGTGSFALYCGVAQRRLGGSGWRALVSSPAVMAIGTGLCLNNGLAVLEALGGRRSPFHRTPKDGPEEDVPGAPRYRAPASFLLLLELPAACWFTIAAIGEAAAGRWLTCPFLALFAFGFGYVTLASGVQAVADLFITPRPRRAAGAPAA